MNYEKFWKKVLGVDEKVEYEFSIGDRYANVGLIVWSSISLILLLIFGLDVSIFSILILIFTFFYYGFYLKVANAYAFTNKRVLIHKGWLSTRVTSIDYLKITDINIQEPFIDRIITHSGHISINTAGTNYHEVILNNVEKPYEIKKKLDILKDK
jgi:membrane protein YdbS with pleckstrin-like domain